MNIGIRQGECVSPLLVSTVMDKIIKNFQKLPGYKWGDNSRNLVFSADNIVLITESEDDLQQMLYKFPIETKAYNMEISIEKQNP